VPEPGVPESFKVLIKELQSLALDVRVLSEDSQEIEIREEEEDISEMARELGIDLKGHDEELGESERRQSRPADEPAEEGEEEPEEDFLGLNLEDDSLAGDFDPEDEAAAPADAEGDELDDPLSFLRDDDEDEDR